LVAETALSSFRYSAVLLQLDIDCPKSLIDHTQHTVGPEGCLEEIDMMNQVGDSVEAACWIIQMVEMALSQPSVETDPLQDFELLVYLLPGDDYFLRRHWRDLKMIVCV
jgi:hypothetical protein